MDALLAAVVQDLGDEPEPHEVAAQLAALQLAQLEAVGDGLLRDADLTPTAHEAQHLDGERLLEDSLPERADAWKERTTRGIQGAPTAGRCLGGGDDMGESGTHPAVAPTKRGQVGGGDDVRD